MVRICKLLVLVNIRLGTHLVNDIMRSIQPLFVILILKYCTIQLFVLDRTMKRVWKYTLIFINPHNCFNGHDMILGDTAYTESHYIIAHYKVVGDVQREKGTLSNANNTKKQRLNEKEPSSVFETYLKASCDAKSDTKNSDVLEIKKKKEILNKLNISMPKP